MKPLAGVRVLDLTRLLSGPFATQILGDLGAEIIKIEPPGGEKARSNGPFTEDGVSTYFASLNRDKRSVVLDLKRAADRQVLCDLALVSDVLVENYRPGVMERLGLGFRDLHALNPRLIYVACTGFGQTGPYKDRPALDIVIQAMAGTMHITGSEAGPPTRVGFSVGDIAGGLYTAIAALAGIVAREQTLTGGFFDVSMLSAQVALLENAYARYFATGREPERLGSRHPVLAPFQIFDTKTCPIVIAVSTEAHWLKLTAVLERPDLAEALEFRSVSARLRHHALLVEEMERCLRQKSAEEWLPKLLEAEIPSGPVNSIGEAARDPQLAARDIFWSVEAEGKPLRVVGSPIVWEDSGPCSEGHSLSDPGQDQAYVLGKILGYGPDQVDALTRVGKGE